jgi:U2-associated protein SR140
MAGRLPPNGSGVEAGDEEGNSSAAPLLPWGIQAVQPGSLRTITETKLVSFAVGQQKKSRFQKAREDAEEKRREEEKEAARAYESFVASFEAPDDRGAKAFVKGGSGSAGQGELYRVAPATAPKVAALPAPLAISRAQSSNVTATNSKPMREMDKMLIEMKVVSYVLLRSQSTSLSYFELYFQEREEERKARLAARSTNSVFSTAEDDDESASQQEGARLRTKPKGGQIDAFLNEILQERAATVVPPIATFTPPPVQASSEGSFDNGDPSTTNLYVGNLAPIVTEEQLIELFGAFGAINSVKVMWPRTAEEKAKKRNCGFVSFMRRRDAEDAKVINRGRGAI